MPPQERRHEEVFGLGDSFTCSGAAARGGGLGGLFAVLWRTLSPFVLRVVAGACVGRGRACERILPSVVSDIRRGDSRDGKRGRGG